MMGSVSLINGHIDDDITDEQIIKDLKDVIKENEFEYYHLYRSPIELITSDFQMKVGKSIDEQIYNAVLNVGVNVDKPELLKALQHDRKQYQKGYVDGMKEFAERFESILATYECTFIETQNWSARNTILQVIQELRNLVKEMAGEG